MDTEHQHEPKSLDAGDLRLAILAAAKAYDSKSFVIVGRASLAASLPDCDPSLRSTMDVDLFPPWNEGKTAVWAAADITIGRVSAFRKEHGFYVERVAEWTTKLLPPGWDGRMVRFVIDDIDVGALHPMDLVCAKLQAGRHKDLLFVRSAIESGVTSKEAVHAFVQEHVHDEAHRSFLVERLGAAMTAAEENEE